jgi:hypothetical protein
MSPVTENQNECLTSMDFNAQKEAAKVKKNNDDICMQESDEQSGS